MANVMSVLQIKTKKMNKEFTCFKIIIEKFVKKIIFF